MKRIIFSIFAVAMLHSVKVSAQSNPECNASATNPISCTFLYTYDNAGNRISRQLQVCICPPPDNRTADNNPQQQVDNTMGTADDKGGNVQTGTTGAAQTAKAAQIASVTPNPTSSGVVIQFSSEVTQGVLLITDSTGKQLFAVAVRGSSLEFDFSDYPSGLYYVSLRTDSDFHTQKVVKTDR